MDRAEPLLAGVRVLELGHIVAGPTASLILAELGADVIKVERPGSGDQARFSRGDQGYFLAFNGSKRSLTLDLKSKRGAEAFRRLLKTADVVLDNYGPGVLERMGFGYDEMARINPAVLHCGIKGPETSGQEPRDENVTRPRCLRTPVVTFRWSIVDSWRPLAMGIWRI